MRKTGFFRCVGYIPDAIKTKFRLVERRGGARTTSEVEEALRAEGIRKWGSVPYCNFVHGERSLSEPTSSGTAVAQHSCLQDEIVDEELPSARTGSAAGSEPAEEPQPTSDPQPARSTNG